MDRIIKKHIDSLIERYPELVCVQEQIMESFDILKNSY